MFFFLKKCFKTIQVKFFCISSVSVDTKPQIFVSVSEEEKKWIFCLTWRSVVAVVSPQRWPSCPGPFPPPAAAACSWLPQPWRAPHDSGARAPRRAAPPRTGPACLGDTGQGSGVRKACGRHHTRIHAVGTDKKKPSRRNVQLRS